jgi:hypothetical protein
MVSQSSEQLAALTPCGVGAARLVRLAALPEITPLAPV